MHIQPPQSFEWCLDMIRGYISDLLSFKHADEPPIVITIVQKEHALSLDDVRLTINASRERVEGVDELKVDNLTGYRDFRQAVQVVQVVTLIFVRAILEYRVLVRGSTGRVFHLDPGHLIAEVVGLLDDLYGPGAS
jgi:hypothetical protein